jgi:hypothetical protein
MPQPMTDLHLDYRLTEADVHHYCSAGRVGKCWRCCRGRKAAMALLAALGCFLVGVCFLGHGARSGMLALGTTFVVVAAFAWIREARFEGCVERLARETGLPHDLRLVVSPDGIAEESEAPAGDRARTFAWSEVVEVSRIDRLTLIRLRPAGAVLIVPDSAFESTESRLEFERTLREWREAALADPSFPVIEPSVRPGLRG